MAITINLTLAIIGIVCGFPILCPIANIVAAGVFVAIDRSEARAVEQHAERMRDAYEREMAR